MIEREDANDYEWGDINNVNPAECDEQDIVQLIYDFQRVNKHICYSPEELKAAVSDMIDNAYFLIDRHY